MAIWRKFFSKPNTNNTIIRSREEDVVMAEEGANTSRVTDVFADEGEVACAPVIDCEVNTSRED